MKLFKTIGRFILTFFGNKKTFDIDGNGKIETLREEIAGVFAQFKKMNDKLNDVNEQLKEVINAEEAAKEVEEAKLEEIIASAKARLLQSDRIIEKANAEIEANEKLKEKVGEFIVK